MSRCFKDNSVRAVIIKNPGVVPVGKNLDEARSIVDSLEEWAKIFIVRKIFNECDTDIDNGSKDSICAFNLNKCSI